MSEIGRQTVQRAGLFFKKKKTATCREADLKLKALDAQFEHQLLSSHQNKLARGPELFNSRIATDDPSERPEMDRRGVSERTILTAASLGQTLKQVECVRLCGSTQSSECCVVSRMHEY